MTFSNLHASPNNRMSMRQDSIIVQIQNGASMTILQLSNFLCYCKLRSSMHLNIAYFAILMQRLHEVSQTPQPTPLQVLAQPGSTRCTLKKKTVTGVEIRTFRILNSKIWPFRAFEKLHFMCCNGRKTTLEWPKVVLR